MTLRFSAPRNCLTALLLGSGRWRRRLLSRWRKRSRSNEKAAGGGRGKLPRVDKTRGLEFPVRGIEGGARRGQRQSMSRLGSGRCGCRTPSDTAALLMQRAKAAMDAHQIEVAQKLLDAVVKLRPDYIEGWNPAGGRFLSQERLRPFARGYRGRCCRAKPRHFGALRRARHDHAGYRRRESARSMRSARALAVNPHLDKVPELGQEP